MSLSDYVRIHGRGQGRARSMTFDEAEAAMGLMLRDEAAPEAIGALLMLMRMRGETAEEIAGFAKAAQAAVPMLPASDLDWPSYAAGRTRGLPWFLLSAQLVAQAGYKVLLHGYNGSCGDVRAGLAPCGIPQVRVDTAALALAQQGIAYLPLEDLSPRLKDLLALRDVLGLRSCLNTVARMLNPAQAGASVQGVFHPSYRGLQQDAARLLGWPALSVIKGGGGEFETAPAKPLSIFGLRGGAAWETQWDAGASVSRHPGDMARDMTHFVALWAGDVHDPFAEAVVLQTATLALDTLGAQAPAQMAARLWHERRSRQAA